jgi:hypothetical protein
LEHTIYECMFSIKYNLLKITHALRMLHTVLATHIRLGDQLHQLSFSRNRRFTRVKVATALNMFWATSPPPPPSKSVSVSTIVQRMTSIKFPYKTLVGIRNNKRQLMHQNICNLYLCKSPTYFIWYSARTRNTLNLVGIFYLPNPNYTFNPSSPPDFITLTTEDSYKPKHSLKYSVT